MFFDVGANVGFYSLLGSKIAGPRGVVVAFEPFPRNLSFLWRHLDLNRARNVTILPMACAERDALERFIAGENHALGRLAGEIAADSGRAPGTRISTITLDSAVARLQLQPDVVKIDVEGAELRVLAGAETLLAQTRPAILLSTHSDALRTACLRLLAEKDYVVRPLNSAAPDTATEFLAEPRTQA
ncbi:MAG: FkbM family methyltransferase [Chthoniobacterales bacterium]